MNETLLEKYKPTNINDFYFSQEFKNLIDKLIELNELSVLITGHSSCGKTSLIDILINIYYNSINKLKRKDNILYINPLKDMGIQYFRNEIKIFCQSYCNIKNKKKIVVIDDIDLIGDQTQQVLRNIIDNYSNNVLFLCSCNSISKVIDNLQSRLFIVKMPNIDNIKLERICKNIIVKENIDINQEAINFIIKISNNSPCLLINYLQVFYLLEKKIDLQMAIELCTTINYYTFDKYYNYLKNNKINEAIECLTELYDQGYSVMDIYDAFYNYIKYTNEINEEIKYKIIPAICKYITIFHEIHENEIELAIFTNTLYKKINNVIK